jgi:hypothetical protein
MAHSSDMASTVATVVAWNCFFNAILLTHHAYEMDNRSSLLR